MLKREWKTNTCIINKVNFEIFSKKKSKFWFGNGRVIKWESIFVLAQRRGVGVK